MSMTLTIPVAMVRTAMGANSNSLDAITPPWPMSQYEYATGKIEKIGAHGGLAYTITFTDRNLNMYRQNYLIEMVYKKCGSTRGCEEYYFAPEYSGTGRFHLHGAVYCPKMNSHSNLQRKLRKEFGIIKVKQIDNSIKWAEYCTKEKEKHKPKEQ